MNIRITLNVMAGCLVLLIASLTPGQSRIPAYNTLQLGQGYNSLTGEAKSKCVEFKEEAVNSAGNGQSGGLEISLITNLQEFSNEINLSASASFGLGIYKGNASLDYMQSGQISRYEENLLVAVRAENKRRIGKSPALTTEAKELLQNDPAEFLNTCGDSYVSGDISGGQFSAIFNAEANSEADQKQIHASFSAASLSNSVSADLEAKFKSLVKNGQLSAKVIRSGASDDYPEADVLKMIEYARKYPSKVALNGSPWVTEYLLSEYGILIKGVQVRSVAQQRALDKLAEHAHRLYERRAGLQFIKLHPEQFGSPSISRIEDEIENLSDQLGDLREQAENCAEDEEKCSAKTYPRIASLPQRAGEWIPINPREEWTVIGTVTGADKAVVEARGKWWADCNFFQHVRATGVNHFRFEDTLKGVEVAYTPSALRYLAPPNTRISFQIGDSKYDDNCPFAGDPVMVRMFTPIYPDEYPAPPKK